MKTKNIIISLLLIMIVFITGCSSNKIKVAATLDSFNTVTTNKGFTVTNNTEAYKDVNYITGSMKAIYEDIEIEMVQYSDSETAGLAQDSHIESFNLLRSTGAHEVKDKGKNYYRYALVSNGRYMISSRIDNTLIFCKAMLDDKELVEKIMDELDY